MNWAIVLTLWAVLSFPLALFLGPRVGSLTTSSPMRAFDQSHRQCDEVRP